MYSATEAMDPSTAERSTSGSHYEEKLQAMQDKTSQGLDTVDDVSNQDTTSTPILGSRKNINMDTRAVESSTPTVSDGQCTTENACRQEPMPLKSLPDLDHSPITPPAQILHTPAASTSNSSPEQKTPQTSQNEQTRELSPP